MSDDAKGCLLTLVFGALIVFAVAVEIAKGVTWLRWAFG